MRTRKDGLSWWSLRGRRLCSTVWREAPYQCGGELLLFAAFGILNRMKKDKDDVKKERFKTFIYLDPNNAEWLDITVATMKRTRQRTNRSELIELGVALLRKKSLKDIAKLLSGPEG